MRKNNFIFVLILFLLSFSSFGQNKRKTEDKAFSYYITNQYDAAAVLYEKVLSTRKNQDNSYLLRILGECYAHSNEFEKAEAAYLKCIEDTIVDRFLSSQRKCCHGLAELYMKQYHYDNALKYMLLAEKKFPRRYVCNAGKIDDKLDIEYRFARCFAGLNLLDSAVAHLTPYMFYQASYFMDTLEYENVLNDYFQLLNKRYTKKEINDELNRAVENIQYHKQRRADSTPESDWYEVRCYFYLFGNEVVLEDVGYEASSWSEESAKVFTKEYIVNEFLNTSAYKMLSR